MLPNQAFFGRVFCMSKRRRVKVPQAMRLEKNGSMNFKVVRSNLNPWISIFKRNVFKTIQFLGHLIAPRHYMRNWDSLKELPRFEAMYHFCRTQPSGCISIYSSGSFCLFYLLWFSVEEMAYFIVQKNNVRKSIKEGSGFGGSWDDFILRKLIAK